MTYGYIGNVAKWAYLMIENVIPCIHDPFAAFYCHFLYLYVFWLLHIIFNQAFSLYAPFEKLHHVKMRSATKSIEYRKNLLLPKLSLGQTWYRRINFEIANSGAILKFLLVR